MIVEAPVLQRWLSYDEALLYCQFCNHDGYADWRIPTFSEWLNEMTDLNAWHQGRMIGAWGATWFVVPVRDV
jgi:hypothetical protein